MYDLVLVKPSEVSPEQINEYIKSFLEKGENHINGTSGLLRYDDLSEWLDMISKKEIDTINDEITASTYFTLRKSDQKIIGSIQLRHHLDDELKEHGGHIGYGISPLERNKGYGKEQLRLVLEKASERKIPKVLITCRKDNQASKRTAISCGGVFLKETIYEGVEQLHFIIQLSESKR
ncbi:MAG: GNAT family N-acetyltransferase [Clostridia bacterium]|nr:GNAT family N-acetyltransferase [Clostridia bacterium]